jgi:peptidoglycan/xylan/chitin deacetylase (PgdA/CDA1 family)
VYVPILAYHKVSDQFEWGINTVSIRSFESQMKYLSENHYYAISLEQYCDGDFQVKSKYHPVIITFDDADESVYHHAFTILRHYGFTATLFVISGYVGKINSWDANLGGISLKHLSWEEIRQLTNEGWEIGSHTATHRDLLGLSIDEVTKELQSSKEIIENNVERPIRFVSYPFNRFDSRITLVAQRIGYRGGCALSLNNNMNGAPKQFIMQRHGVYSIDSLSWFKKKLSNSKIEQIKQRIISFASRGTILYNRFRK